MKHQESKQELESLILAGHPLIYAVSDEEKHVAQAIREILAKHDSKRPFFFWSNIGGFSQENPETAALSEENKRILEDGDRTVLGKVQDFEGDGVFMLLDYHLWLDSKETGMISKMKDVTLKTMASAMRDESVKRYSTEKGRHKKHIVVCSSVLKIPQELSKLFSVAFFSPPGKDEIADFLDRFIESEKAAPLEKEERQALIAASLGLSEKEMFYSYRKSAIKNAGTLKAEDVAAEKKQIVRKNGLLEFFDPKVGFADVGGMKSLTDWIKKRKIAYNEELREKKKLAVPKGVLITGMQGCGKSHAAKASASFLQMPLLRLDMGSMMGSLLGQSEGNLRKAIALAESLSPCVLWIDEIDKSIPDPQSANTHEVTKRLMSTLLTWLQEKTSHVFVVATANNISHLPPELLRKGRFDEIFFVDLPTEKERREIFEIQLRRREIGLESIDAPALSKGTAGFSGAEIETLIDEALFEAAHADEELETSHISREIENTAPLSETMKDQLKYIREWAKSNRIRRASESEEEARGIGFI